MTNRKIINGVDVLGWSQEDIDALIEDDERIYGEELEEEREGEGLAVWHEGQPVNEFNLADYERKHGILA